MIKYIIFDAYGTIISTGSGSVDAAKKILEKRNVPVSPVDFYAQWKKIHRRHINELETFICEKDIFELDLKELYMLYNIEGDYTSDVTIMLDTLGKRKAFKETSEVLSELAKYYKICIGSTTDHEPLITDLNSNGITVSKVFTSQSLQVYKPDVLFYKKIAEDLKCRYDEILFVGDSLLDDVFGPRQLNISTCWVNRKNEKNDTDIIPTYTVKSLSELLTILMPDK